MRMGIDQAMLTIAEKIIVRDIEYRHIERMQAGIAAHEDTQSCSDGRELNRIAGMVQNRMDRGVSAEDMSAQRAIEREYA